MKAVWPALSLALASAVFLFALGLKIPAAQEPVALVFGPSVSSAATLERLAALDGRIVRVGGTDNIVIARFDRDVTLRQLWGQGVWFGLDPVFMGGCFSTSSSAGNGNVS
jgi:hypothetical protein